MYRLVLFIKKVYVLLLFIILEATALHLYANSSSYTTAKLLTISNLIVGQIYYPIHKVTTYFSLKRENDILTAEVIDLRNQLENQSTNSADTMLVEQFSLDSSARYKYLSANIINNSTSRIRNLITIDKGLRDGVKQGMAIATMDGAIAGYVLQSSDRFAVAMSILNSGFRGSGRINNSEWYGSIQWSGESYQHLTLSEIPKYAEISVGDTITTTNYSAIFPAGLTVGYVESFKLNESQLYDIQVKIKAPMASLNRVMVIEYFDSEEREMLEIESDVINKSYK